MTYKWSLDYIDSLTWPTIDGLLKMIKGHPPVDLFIKAVFSGGDKKEAAKIDDAHGFPTRKGKIGVVRKR